MTDAPATQRLFFALWPDDATRDALDRTGKWLHRHWGGRRMRADTLHLTLAFLGDTPAAARDAFLPMIDAIRAEPLRRVLGEPGVALDARPFVPHVRLLRSAAGGPVPACAPVRWRVEDFVLATSRTDAGGARYEIAGRWPLA